MINEKNITYTGKFFPNLMYAFEEFNLFIENI